MACIRLLMYTWFVLVESKMTSELTSCQWRWQVYGDHPGLTRSWHIEWVSAVVASCAFAHAPMVETAMPSCSVCDEIRQQSGVTCGYNKQARCTGSKSPKYASSGAARTLNPMSSIGFTGVFVVLASFWLSPCYAGLNCTGFNISCYHGTCVEVRLSMTPGSPAVNLTVRISVVCLCDDHWSGPACDVFSCSGRTLWVLHCIGFWACHREGPPDGCDSYRKLPESTEN